jgi:DNA-directed RNA polymerase subunit RPC12/RpoP
MGSDEVMRTCTRCGREWFVPKSLSKDRPLTMVLGGLAGALLAAKHGEAKRCPDCGSISFRQGQPAAKLSSASRVPPSIVEEEAERGRTVKLGKLLDSEVGHMTICPHCGWKVPIKLGRKKLRSRCVHCGRGLGGPSTPRSG